MLCHISLERGAILVLMISTLLDLVHQCNTECYGIPLLLLGTTCHLHVLCIAFLLHSLMMHGMHA